MKNRNIEILLPTLQKQFDNLDKMLGFLGFFFFLDKLGSIDQLTFLLCAVDDWERASSNNNLYTVY